MTYYGKLCTTIYDLDKPSASIEELHLYTQFISSKQSKILEPMCGSGRFYIPVIKEGYDITGFDLSQEMLDSCIKKCSEVGITPKVFKADITKYKCKQEFEYIFIPFGSISLLTNENQIDQCFKNMSECLVQNGKFIFSFMNEHVNKENIPSWKETMRFPIKDKEIICKQKVEFIPNQNLLDIKLLYELLQNGIILESEQQDFPIRLYNKEYIEKKLKENGFINIEFLSSKDISKTFTILKCQKQ